MKNEPVFPTKQKIPAVHNRITGHCMQGSVDIEFAGLTKRELFAAVVLSGLVSKAEYSTTDVKDAVYYADALLAELEKGKEEK